MTYAKNNLGELLFLLVLIVAVVLLASCTGAADRVMYQITCYSGGEVVYSGVVVVAHNGFRYYEVPSGRIIKADNMECILLELEGE